MFGGRLYYSDHIRRDLLAKREGRVLLSDASQLALVHLDNFHLLRYFRRKPDRFQFRVTLLPWHATELGLFGRNRNQFIRDFSFLKL